ncbi:MAG: type II secretion system F family protein [Candidatus Micrarchaeia archaeon]
MAEKARFDLSASAAKPKAPQPLVAQPMRESEGPKDPERFRGLMISLAGRFPFLKRSLSQADMRYTPAGFAKVALITAIYISAALLLVVWLLIRNEPSSFAILLGLAPVFYFLAFLYAMQYPNVKASMRARGMEQELVFAGRHMLIELKSGVPLFDAMLGISRDYGEISLEFNKVVEKVTLGVPLGVALHEVADNNPSQYFRRVVLQMANSLASGSDVSLSLEASLDQISKEQAISLKAYGQKLNPLVMFFMIFGIILPSLGVAFIVILTSFLGGAGVSFGSSALFGVLVAIGLVQFVFLSMVENSRPRFDIY